MPHSVIWRKIETAETTWKLFYCATILKMRFEHFTLSVNQFEIPLKCTYSKGRILNDTSYPNIGLPQFEFRHLFHRSSDGPVSIFCFQNKEILIKTQLFLNRNTQPWRSQDHNDVDSKQKFGAKIQIGAMQCLDMKYHSRSALYVFWGPSEWPYWQRRKLWESINSFYYVFYNLH